MLWELKVIKRVNNILNLVEKRKPLHLLLFFTLILDFELTKFHKLKVKCKGNHQWSGATKNLQNIDPSILNTILIKA